jgi:hypothetical protein
MTRSVPRESVRVLRFAPFPPEWSARQSFRQSSRQRDLRFEIPCKHYAPKVRSVPIRTEAAELSLDIRPPDTPSEPRTEGAQDISPGLARRGPALGIPDLNDEAPHRRRQEKVVIPRG